MDSSMVNMIIQLGSFGLVAVIVYRYFEQLDASMHRIADVIAENTRVMAALISKLEGVVDWDPAKIKKGGT